MNIDQESIIETLIAHESKTSYWHEPIDAVARATGMMTLEARRYVEGLKARGLVIHSPRVGKGQTYNAAFRWARTEN